MPAYDVIAKLPEEHARDRGLHYRRHWAQDENEWKAVDIERIEKLRKERQADYMNIAKE